MTKTDRRNLRVQMDLVIDAMTAGRDEVFHHFLDLNKGTVLMWIDPEHRDPDIPDDDSRLVDDSPDDYEEIPRIETQVEYGWMERFAAEIEEDDLQLQLGTALSGKGAFRRFREVLARYPDLEESWYSARREWLEEEAVTWMQGLGIEPMVSTPYDKPNERKPPQSKEDRIQLLDVLLLGSEKTELLEGRVWKHFKARSKGEAQRIYAALARDVCAFYGVGWRKRFLDGSEFELERMRLRLDDDVVELSIEMPRKVWDAFSG